MTTTFLRLCLNSPRDPQALAAAQALAGGLDWAGVARQAQAASLEALLYQQLKPQGDLLPPAVAAAWQAAYRYNAQRQLYLAHQLGQALAALNAAGVPVLLLKGAALAHTLYAHPAGRPFRDLDLLIRPGQTTAAFATLRQLGYTPHHPEPHPGVTRQFENEMLWQRPGPIVTYLDLHWQLLDSPHYQARLDSTWLWQTAVTSTPASLPFALRHLGPEAQLLHLCAHLLLHHGGQELLWRNDIAAHLYHTQATLDWDLLLRQAARSDLLLPLQTLLPDLAAQWAAPVPAGVLAQLATCQPTPAEQRIFRWRRQANARPVLQRFWYDLASMPGWRPRLRYALVHLFPGRDYMRQRYPLRHPRLWPLTYPYRWLHGLFQALSKSDLTDFPKSVRS